MPSTAPHDGTCGGPPLENKRDITNPTKPFPRASLSLCLRFLQVLHYLRLQKPPALSYPPCRGIISFLSKFVDRFSGGVLGY